jgi:hypothetical protein
MAYLALRETWVSCGMVVYSSEPRSDVKGLELNATASLGMQKAFGRQQTGNSPKFGRRGTISGARLSTIQGATTTLPFIKGCRRQKYSNVPALSKVNLSLVSSAEE